MVMITNDGNVLLQQTQGKWLWGYLESAKPKRYLSDSSSMFSESVMPAT